MALSDYRINSFTKPVSALDDKPQMSAAQLKEWFDSNSTKELKESVNGLIDELGEVLSGKVDTADGKGLSSNDYTDEEKAKVHEHANKAVLDKITAEYTTAEKAKLSGIEEGANNYTHPESHSADMITETASKRFTSDTELSGKVDTVDGKGLSSNDYTDEDKAKVHEHANKAVLDKITAAPALATENLPRISWEEMDTFDGEVAVVEKVENTMDSDTPIWTDNEGTTYYSGYHYEYNYILMQHIKYCAQVSDDGNNASRDGYDERTQILYCPDGSVKMRTGDTYDNTSFTWTDWQTIGVPVNAADKAKVDKIDTLQSAVNVISDKVFRESPKTWADVQSIVRAGLANEYFSIGDQLTCSHDTYGTLTWDIIGIDHDTPADPSRKHSMTLQMHDLWPTAMIYDSPEATWYIDEETYPTGLVAGTYHFTLPAGYDNAYGGGSTLNFTLANDVPVGGQVRFAWGYQVQANTCKISTYASAGAATAIETVTVAEGEAGTAMPTLHATATTENTNCVHRIRYGSNNWAESGVRQWLNTDAAANTWWEPKTVFDRPTNASNAGFLKGLDPAFLDVVGEVIKDTQQSISDGYGHSTSTERFFLLSRPEIYAGTERSADGADGKVYAYYGAGYSDLASPGTEADSNRIKYRSGSATYWWLRTPSSTSGGYVRTVYPAGNLNYNSALNSIGVAPACVIV